MASYRDFLPVVSSGDWVRPSDWLPMPVVTDTEQKFVGLHGVWEDGDNVVAFLFAGNYTVDWGDGVVENVASGVKAEHQYSWASIPAGTTTSQGYRQVIITVTPQVGQNLTSCNFQQRFTARNQAYATGFLDVTLSMPNAGSGASVTFGGTTVIHGKVERATVLTIGGATSMASMFNGFVSLQSVPLFNTSAVTVLQSAFSDCRSLRNIPLFNTTNVNTFSDTFQRCSSLITVPLLDMSNNTNLGNTFLGCVSLLYVPNFNTPLLQIYSNTFNSCVNLRTVPIINTDNVTSFAAVFFNASNLVNIPAYNAINATSIGNFCQGTSSLSRCEMININATLSFLRAGLSAPAIVEIFNNLVDRSATTSATITITGNWGTPLLTAGEIAIATSKNWIVTT
jgi:hypothetical protein